MIHSEKKFLFYLLYIVPLPKLPQRGPLKPGHPVSETITLCFMFSVQEPALGSHTITWSCLLVLWNAAGIERKVSTDGTQIRSEEGPKVLAAPPTAYMVQTIFLLAVAVNTLGGYNWRHHGDF